MPHSCKTAKDIIETTFYSAYLVQYPYTIIAGLHLDRLSLLYLNITRKNIIFKLNAAVIGSRSASNYYFGDPPLFSENSAHKTFIFQYVVS